MTSTAHLNIMIRYNELWSKDGLEKAAEVLSPDFIRYGTSGRLKGITDFRRFVEGFLESFPDIRFLVDDWMECADTFVIRYKMVGTHRAPFLGVPATGVRINVDGAAVYKIVDDRLTELWDYMDLLTLYRQLNIPLFKTH